jgi:putative glutamine amidotransferase
VELALKRPSEIPIIGISCSMEHADKKRRSPTAYSFDYLKRSYYEAVERSGGATVSLPNTKRLNLADRFLDLVHGLLISGGNDVDPAFYGERKKVNNLSVTRERDLFEIRLVKRAKARRIPILAICRGMQLVNVAFGGNLYQDYHMESSFLDHTLGGSTVYKKRHPVLIQKSSRLFGVIGKSRVMVNTSHHQIVKKVALGFTAVARSEKDGVIEGIEPKGEDAIICVQWHPELMKDSGSKALFDWLVESAKRHWQRKSKRSTP